MVKSVSVWISFILVCALMCGGTFAEVTENNQWNDEKIIEMLITESWFSLYDSDVYTFSADGTAKHNESSIKYTVTNGVITIKEGILGKETKTFVFDTSGDIVLLVTPENNYFLRQTDYDEISLEIRNEYTKFLISQEAWSVKRNGLFYAYYMFNSSGGGFVLTYSGTVGMSWSFIDNNTIKLTADNLGSTVLDIVDNNGVLSLVSPNSDAIKITPKW